jgi:hypothetical protein
MRNAAEKFMHCQKRVFFDSRKNKKITLKLSSTFLWYLVMKNSSKFWHFSEADVCSYDQKI